MLHCAHLRMCCRVSQKFLRIFEHTPSLFSTLLLHNNFSGLQLQGMTRWIHKHGNTVATLVAHTKSFWLDIALGNLLSSNLPASLLPPLGQACLHDVGPATVRTLSYFSGLTRLELQVPLPDQGASGRQNLDLYCLQALPHLVHLQLQNGRCLHLETLNHLTSLNAMNCHVFCDVDGGFVSSLQSLTVHESHVWRFHVNGLLACSRLKSLQLHSGYVRADNPYDHMAFSRTVLVVPHSLSALTSLTALSL